MGRAIEVWEGEGGAHSSAASSVVHSTRRHRTLWVGVFCAMAIVIVLAVAAKLD